MLLENFRPGYNLFLIELYAHLSVGFVLYNASDLMGNHFYWQTLKWLWKFKDVVMHFGMKKRFFFQTQQPDFYDQRVSAAIAPHREMNKDS